MFGRYRPSPAVVSDPSLLNAPQMLADPQDPNDPLGVGYDDDGAGAFWQSTEKRAENKRKRARKAASKGNTKKARRLREDARRLEARAERRSDGLVIGNVDDMGYLGEEEDIATFISAAKRMHRGWHSDEQPVVSLAQGEPPPGAAGIVVGNLNDGMFRKFGTANITNPAMLNAPMDDFGSNLMSPYDVAYGIWDDGFTPEEKETVARVFARFGVNPDQPADERWEDSHFVMRVLRALPDDLAVKLASIFARHYEANQDRISTAQAESMAYGLLDDPFTAEESDIFLQTMSRFGVTDYSTDPRLDDTVFTMRLLRAMPNELAYKAAIYLAGVRSMEQERRLRAGGLYVGDLDDDDTDEVDDGRKGVFYNKRGNLRSRHKTKHLAKKYAKQDALENRKAIKQTNRGLRQASRAFDRMDRRFAAAEQAGPDYGDEAPIADAMLAPVVDEVSPAAAAGLMVIGNVDGLRVPRLWQMYAGEVGEVGDVGAIDEETAVEILDFVGMEITPANGGAATTVHRSQFREAVAALTDAAERLTQVPVWIYASASDEDPKRLIDILVSAGEPIDSEHWKLVGAANGADTDAPEEPQAGLFGSKKRKAKRAAKAKMAAEATQQAQAGELGALYYGTANITNPAMLTSPSADFDEDLGDPRSVRY